MALILSKMGGYVRIFQDKDGNKDRNMNNKLLLFHIGDHKLLETLHEKRYFTSPRISWKSQKHQLNVLFPSISEKFKA